MALIFWLFLTYSFLGYLLEKLFAALTRSERQVRKCFLLLPLCPVYGLGVLAVLALPESLTDSFWGLALWGGLTATAVEYGVHWAYDALLGVRFWDYSPVPGNLRGRVCPAFSFIWGLLLAGGLPGLQPILLRGLATVPESLTGAVWLIFVVDCVLSIRLLWLYRDTELLSVARFRRMRYQRTARLRKQ